MTFPTGREPRTIDHEIEPAWVRDGQAAQLVFNLESVGDAGRIPQMVAEICEGEILCCEYCGAPFPMWPFKEWADHQLREHGDGMTLQVRAGTALLCDAQINPAIQSLFEAQFSARANMRRRAWKLGHMRVLEPEKPKGRIHLEN